MRTRRASYGEIDKDTRQDTLVDSVPQGQSTMDDRLFLFLEAFSRAQAESNRILLENIAAQSYRASDHHAHSTESPVPFPVANPVMPQGGNFVKCTARFDGASQNPETLEAFLDAVLVFKECSSVSDEHALRGLPMLLTGDAAVFYQGVKSSVKSWDDALQRLRSMYGTPRPAYKLFRDVFAAEQGTERADVFIARLRATLSKLPYELEDRVKVDIIYGLLDRRIRKRIQPDAVSSVDQLVEKARAIEESLAESTSLTPKPPPVAAGRSVPTTGSTPAAQPRAAMAAPQLLRAANAANTVSGAPATSTAAATYPRSPHPPTVPTGQVITARQDSYVVNRKIDVPQFERPIGNHTFHIGREAVLGCSVINLGKHKVGWLRAEDQTVLTMHERAVLGSRYSVNLDAPMTWQLRIRPLRAEDRGCYMCQINTQPNMKWQIGCIDVYVPPDIINDDTSADVSAQELDNVTLICRASGHPPPKITWRREDHEPMLLKKVGGRDFYKVESYVGSSLPLWRVDRRQMGAFLCIASNDVPPAVSKRITLSVNFPPTVIVPNQLLGAPLGTDVILECTVEAFPNTINYWLKNRGEMLLDGPKYIINEERSSYKVSMKLTIKHFSRSDIGTYNCVSTNSLGKSEGTLRLYEIKVYPSLQSAAEVNVGGLTEGAVKQKTELSNGNCVQSRTFSIAVSIFLLHCFV